MPRLPAITLTLRRHWLAAPRVVVGLAAKAEEAGWNGVYRPGPRALAGVGARQAADSWIVWGE